MPKKFPQTAIVTFCILIGVLAVPRAYADSIYDAECGAVFDHLQTSDSFDFEGFQTAAAIEAEVSPTPPVIKNVGTGEGYAVTAKEYDYLSRHPKFWVTYRVDPSGKRFIRSSLALFATTCSEGPKAEVEFESVPSKVLFEFLVTVKTAANYGEGDYDTEMAVFKNLGKAIGADTLRNFIQNGAD